MADRVVIQAPRADYNGKTLGLRFNDGVAVLDETTAPRALGRSPRQIVEAFRQDFPAYQVSAAPGRHFTVPDLPWKEAEAGEVSAEMPKPKRRSKPKAKAAA